MVAQKPHKIKLNNSGSFSNRQTGQSWGLPLVNWHIIWNSPYFDIRMTFEGPHVNICIVFRTPLFSYLYFFRAPFISTLQELQKLLYLSTLGLIQFDDMAISRLVY